MINGGLKASRRPSVVSEREDAARVARTRVRFLPLAAVARTRSARLNGHHRRTRSLTGHILHRRAVCANDERLSVFPVSPEVAGWHGRIWLDADQQGGTGGQQAVAAGAARTARTRSVPRSQVGARTRDQRRAILVQSDARIPREPCLLLVAARKSPSSLQKAASRIEEIGPYLARSRCSSRQRVDRPAPHPPQPSKEWNSAV